MRVDLHTHSTASDGRLAPRLLLQEATEAGIDLLAITDHDCVDAHDELAGVDTGPVRLVTGIEFSTTWKNRGVHVVGLGIDLGHPMLREGIARQRDARTRRATRIAARLEGLGCHGILEEVSELAAGGNIGRPHFARCLVARGMARDFDAAFRRFLGQGRRAWVATDWASLPEVVAWIRAAGGTAVLAHPLKYGLTRTKLGELVRAFGECGGQAMEVVCGQQQRDATSALARLCRETGLLGSCGSDFHEPGRPGAVLGRVAPLPEDCTPVWTTWPA